MSNYSFYVRSIWNLNVQNYLYAIILLFYVE